MQQKRISSSSSAAIIGGSDDLLTEILVLLPAKSLFRFRGVSKQLRSLIDEESFHHRHRVNRHRRRPQDQLILRTTEKPHQTFICDPTAKTLLPLRFESLESEYPHVKVHQTRHGLLLLECRKKPHGERKIYVYNRTTAQRRFLLKVTSLRLLLFCLIYDPSKSHHYTVFYLKENDSYLNNYAIDIQVYDSRTHKWESKAKSHERIYDFPHGVLCNDRLYLRRRNTLSPSMCFTPDNLHFSAVTSPPRCCSSSSRQKRYVVGSNGRLHYLVVSTTKSRCVRLDVFEMIDDGRWVISRRVGSDRPLSASFGDEEIGVLGYVRGDREEELEEDSILVYGVPGKIMSYRFRDEVSEEIVDCSLLFRFKDSHHFVDDFASV